MAIYESVQKRVLSDENIFLAVSFTHSYVKETGLLSKEDKDCLARLRDIYNEQYMEQIVVEVRKRIIAIMENDNMFFKIRVYFKPKKREDGDNIFRPIHTASLIDQIAMIAMAQILIYDVELCNNGSNALKLVPSELSRLIPSNFFGNRVSYNGTQLFKPWKEQYHKYAAKSSELLAHFSTTQEYRYEVSLDLQDFFPSINPCVLYNLICSKLPLAIAKQDCNTIRKIIKKLLIFQLENQQGEPQFTIEEWKWYLNKSKDNVNRSIEKLDSNAVIYAKGLPQGLPHTYYLGNLMMLEIYQAYKEVFPGEMLFYVDDSVIFTNILENNENAFNEFIKNINQSIKAMEKRYCKDLDAFVFPDNYTYSTEDFGICVHKAGKKSTFSHVREADAQSGEMYLSGLCRETSMIGTDIYFADSDEDVEALRSRTSALLSAVENEIERIKQEETEQTWGENEIYLRKLIRYRKFFRYRLTILQYRCEGNVEALQEDLFTEILKQSNNIESDHRHGLFDVDNFFEKYTDDILAVLIPLTLEKYQKTQTKNKDLEKILNLLNSNIYGENTRYSYITCTCKQFFEDMSPHVTVYDSLYDKVRVKYTAVMQQNYKLRKQKLDEIFNLVKAFQIEDIFKELEFSKLYKYGRYIRGSSDVLERRILNAIYSFLLGYHISDTYVFAKSNCEIMQYADLRILALLRNPRFSISNFQAFYLRCIQDEFCVPADYSILQVLDIFKTFVISPERIDDLILIHKYCCDTWKNGSKHLYFYTLHNQEHAVTLIQNARNVISTISHFELKAIDYFILFAACYLHDISMVTFPDYKTLYTEDNEETNLIATHFANHYDASDSIKAKRALYETYQEIDSYFEAKVRNNHAADSAREIRTFPELDFIEPTMREMIACVAHGHGQDILDVYYQKSHGRNSLVSKKWDMILLRVSDLLDMSRYRISKVIFDHNLHNINPVSRFHWISHLLTDGYTLKVEYQNQPTSSSNTSFIARKNIVEKITLTIDVLISQTTAVPRSTKCNHVATSKFSFEDNGHATIILKCDKGKVCKSDKCNFLCKWFTRKNEYLIEEITALQEYLNSIDDNFYHTEFEIRVKVISNNNIPNEVFDYLHEYLKK